MIPYDELKEIEDEVIKSIGAQPETVPNMSLQCNIPVEIVNGSDKVEIVVEGANIHDYETLKVEHLPPGYHLQSEAVTKHENLEPYDEMKEIEAQMEEQEELARQQKEVEEQILVEDEDMIVGQITSMEHMEDMVEESGVLLQNVTKLPETGPVSRIVQKPPQIRQHAEFSEDMFTEFEDLIIHALDTISPFDSKFISEHLIRREEATVERRLTDHEFRKKSFAFGKLPVLMFEVLFLNEGIQRSRSLMLLTQTQLVSLRCKQQAACNHGTGLEVLRIVYHPKSRFGIDTGDLCQFILTHIPNKYMPYLRLNVSKLEEYLEAGKVNFHKAALGSSSFSKRDMKQLLKTAVTMDSLRQPGGEPIKIDETGRLTMTSEHEKTLIKIVKAVGKTRWEDATKLLLAVHEHEIDFDVEDTEIFSRIGGYYQLKLDPDLETGVFTEGEDKCIVFLHKFWVKTMVEDSIWKQIARHMAGRSTNQVKNRFLRNSTTATDLTLENIEKFSEDPTNPATYNNDMAHVFALTVVPKNKEGTPTNQEVTCKLQHEVRFLVCGTLKEIFLLPCKETAVRCTHMGMLHTTFTYDSERPAQQFVTFIKLTFANGLKKAGLIEDPDDFHFSTIVYRGEEIHKVMGKAEDERFIVPKDQFMALNRKMEGLVEGRDGTVLPLKRKYTRRTDMEYYTATTPTPDRYTGPPRPRGRPPGSGNKTKEIFSSNKLGESERGLGRSRSPSNPQDPDYRPSHAPKKFFRTQDGLMGQTS